MILLLLKIDSLIWLLPFPLSRRRSQKRQTWIKGLKKRSFSWANICSINFWGKNFFCMRKTEYFSYFKIFWLDKSLKTFHTFAMALPEIFSKKAWVHVREARAKNFLDGSSSDSKCTLNLYSRSKLFFLSR